MSSATQPVDSIAAVTDLPPSGRRLRVMHVILSRGFAGSERAVVEACAALSDRHDVALVVRRDHRDRYGVSLLDELRPGIEVFEVPALWRTQHRLAQVIDQWRPDIVHTNLRRGTRLVSGLRARPPHFATLHISLNGPHYLRADTLICISDWQLQVVRDAQYGGRLLQIPNSLVPQPRIGAERRALLRKVAGAGPSDFLIGGVGRLTEGKGFDVLVEAFRRAALPASRLVIVGEGNARRALERKSSGLMATFTGFRSDAKDWYQALDLFVSPSRREPFGRVIIEALDAGTPVIATAAQGPLDIAKRFPIEIVPTENVAEMATAMHRAYDRPRARIVADLSEFHLDRVAEKLIEAYRSSAGVGDVAHYDTWALSAELPIVSRGPLHPHKAVKR